MSIYFIIADIYIDKRSVWKWNDEKEKWVMQHTIFRAASVIDKNAIINFRQKNFKDWPKAKYSLFYSDKPSGETICWPIKYEEHSEIIGPTVALLTKIIIKNQPVPGSKAGGHHYPTVLEKIIDITLTAKMMAMPAVYKSLPLL